MKRRIQVFMALGSFILLGAPSAHAQGAGRLRANLPFAFTVGSVTLPAGDYEFSFDDADHPEILTVRSRDGHKSALVLTEAAEVAKAIDEGRVVFERQGDRYSLAKVFGPGERLGLEVLRKHAAGEHGD